MLWQDQRLPFGSPITHQNTSSLGYTGKPYDPDTGLLYLGARYYDPLLGRFLSMDPVEFDEGNLHSFNRYAYANNNPYRYVDPSGKIAETVWDAANLTWGVTSFARNVAIQNYGGAMLDAVGIVYDGIATAVPGLPGGAGAAIKAGRGIGATKSAGERAKEIHSVLDLRAQRARTTAVTETREGVRVVSSSERRLTPAQRAQLGVNEIEGVGVGHAEVTGINAAREMGLTPTGTAASRPICPSCASTLRNQGIDPLSPLK